MQWSLSLLLLRKVFILKINAGKWRRICLRRRLEVFISFLVYLFFVKYNFWVGNITGMETLQY